MKPQFRLTVSEGKTDIAKEFVDYTKTLKDGDYLISVKKQTKVRSNNQNSYYFGVVVKMIAEEVGYTPNETHEALKHKFLSEHGEFPRIKSTSELTTVEFEDYLAKVRMFGSEFCNLYIPLPNEVDIPNSYNFY